MIKNLKNQKPFIDISGPDGNAFALMGTAQKFAKDLSYSKADVKKLTAEMMASDYENLIRVFDVHFGEYVDLIR